MKNFTSTGSQLHKNSAKGVKFMCVARLLRFAGHRAGQGLKPRCAACFERVVHALPPPAPPLLQSAKKPLHTAPAVDFLFILV